MDKFDRIKQFASPPAVYRGKPFWSWNGELNKEELIKQAKQLGQMGFGGYFMHSRCGLITEYLGEEWFELTNAVADASAELGLEAWLYDEDRWPSGSAGGKVTEDVSLRMRSLQLFEYDAVKFEWTDDVRWAFEAEIGDDGVSMPAYRKLEKGTAAAMPKVLAFKVVLDEPNSNYNGNTYIDTMNRAAVDRFIELTHEKYQEKCGERMGTSIFGIFTDEPHRGKGMGDLTEKDGVRSCGIFYTNDIFDEFRARYGYDAEARIPEIFYRLNGEPVSKLRIDYFDLGCDLFNERFSAPIHEWCEKHNIAFTGHTLHEDALGNQTAPVGSLMRFYEHEDTPGIDILGSNNKCYWVAKQCSSVCRQLGRKWMLSELYGCSGWEFSLRSHKIMGDWQQLFGVNLRCPHLSWYTMEGECKRDYPASVSYQSPYWQDYDFIESYFARMGLLLSEGSPVCETLVLEPLESVWGLAHLAWANWIFPKTEDVAAVEKIYAETFMRLAGARVDFDYAEEQIMARRGSVGTDENGAYIRIGEMTYRTFVVSGALTIRRSTLDTIEKFLSLGGRVVFAGELPGYVGGEKSDECAAVVEKYPNAVRVELEKLGDLLADVDDNPVDSDAPAAVFNQVRTDGENIISVWLNTDADKATGDFAVKVSVPDGYRAEYWDLETGSRSEYPAEYKDGALVLNCAMEAAGSMALVFAPAKDDIPAYRHMRSRFTGEMTSGEFEYELDEPNVCVLDYVRTRFADDTEFAPLAEVLKADAALRDRIGIERRGGEMLQPWFAKENLKTVYGRLTLEYPFVVEKMPEGDVYIAGERPEVMEYYLNGVRLTAPDLSDYWVDNAFVKMSVPEGALKMGENIVSVEVDFKSTTNVEAVYLIGDFGVRAEAGKSAIIGKPATLGLDDIALRDMPFYSGRVTLKITAEDYLPYADKVADRILMQISGFEAALVTVEACGRKLPIVWEPYAADVTEAVKASEDIKVTLVNTRRNTFGPLHIAPVRHGSYGPGSFLTEGSAWTDAYASIEPKIGAIRFLAD